MRGDESESATPLVIQSDNGDGAQSTAPASRALPRSAPTTSTWWPHLPVSERKLLLLSGDLAGINLALLGALALGREQLELQDEWFLVISALWLLVAPAMEAYSLRAAATRRTSVLVALRAGLVTTIAYLAIPYVTAPLLTSRAMALEFVALALLWLVLWRTAYATLLTQPRLRTRALVVGAGWAGQSIVQAIREHAASAYDLVGYVDDDPAKLWKTVSGLPVLATSETLIKVANLLNVQEIVLAISRGMRAELHQALAEAFESGIRVVPMAELYEAATLRIPVEHAGDCWYVALPCAPEGGLFHTLIKRAMDVGFGLLGTLGFAAVWPLAALAIKLDSLGPVLYKQERVGKGGRPFQLAKFRSMVADAEQNGRAVWASKGDSRVTRVGRLLRVTHLDELPQFVSILRGDMSLIGPRPERPAFVAELQRQIPFYRVRLLAKPGLTGWAQVMYQYGSSVEDALMKLQYDLYYIKHQSLYLDLLIILKTIGRVLTARGT